MFLRHEGKRKIGWLVLACALISMVVVTWFSKDDLAGRAACAIFSFVGLSIWIGLAVGLRALFYRGRQYWECKFCRYDRRGLPPDAPCPECGRAPASSDG